VTPEAQARELYTAVSGISGIVTTVTTYQQTLAMELLAGADRLEITSFTLNGQSGSGVLRATRSEQLLILNLLLEMLAAGALTTTRRYVPIW
jgi:hypothetical protein